MAKFPVVFKKDVGSDGETFFDGNSLGDAHDVLGVWWCLAQAARERVFGGVLVVLAGAGVFPINHERCFLLD